MMDGNAYLPLIVRRTLIWSDIVSCLCEYRSDNCRLRRLLCARLLIIQKKKVGLRDKPSSILVPEARIRGAFRELWRLWRRFVMSLLFR